MPWSKPIPFRKTVLSAAASLSLNLSLGGVQKVRIINLWAAQLGSPAEINIQYSYQSTSQVWMTIAHTVGEYCVFNGGKYLELWTDELRALFDTDTQLTKSFFFGGSYRVKQ